MGVDTGTQNGRHGVHGQMLWQLATKGGWGHYVFLAAACFVVTCSLGLEANDFHILRAKFACVAGLEFPVYADMVAFAEHCNVLA
jgi:hypothetical protein